MRLFLDRHKTLLPRVDRVYLLLRLLTLVAIVWFIGRGTFPLSAKPLFYAVVGTFALHLVTFYAAIKGKFDLKLAYLTAILYDLLLVPSLILYTGGIQSPFYILVYMTMSVAVYVLTFWFATAVTLVVVSTYILVVSPDVTMVNMFDLSLRVGFILACYLALLYATDHMRRSEKRLLKLFNTLNKRTSELERSQAQLEMIYENTRILASILDTDGVVKEVTQILGDVLQYDCYGMILKDKWGNFYYRARANGGQHNFHLKAVEAGKMGLVSKVSEMGEPIRMKDATGRDDYQPLSETARSVMVVPMISHGKISGVLTAESSKRDHFQERDIQLLSIVARSAGLALENAELHRKTEELTIVDELTEAYNYRYFVQKLEEEKRRALRYSLPLSLVMVDIDWFKKFNDTYGHETGNAVLRKLSAVIKLCIRDVDIFTRYGGEEFAIILPQTPLAEASAIGERIRGQIEASEIDAGGETKLRVTVSVGVSSFPENGKSHEELVSVTDQALYRAKGEGRNLVRAI